jgi:hypothetical protein
MSGVTGAGGYVAGGWRGAAIGAGIGLATQEASRFWMKHKLPKVQEEENIMLKNDVDGENEDENPYGSKHHGLSQKDQFQLGSDGIGAVSAAALGFMAGGPFGAALGAAGSVAIGEAITAGFEFKHKKDAEKLKRDAEKPQNDDNAITDDNVITDDNPSSDSNPDNGMALIRDENGNLVYVPIPAL